MNILNFLIFQIPWMSEIFLTFVVIYRLRKSTSGLVVNRGVNQKVRILILQALTRKQIHQALECFTNTLITSMPMYDFFNQMDFDFSIILYDDDPVMSNSLVFKEVMTAANISVSVSVVC